MSSSGLEQVVDDDDDESEHLAKYYLALVYK